jgi:hypothetical protein
MATLFAPGGLATREEARARRERAVAAAEDRRHARRRRFKGWGDGFSIGSFGAGEREHPSGDATVEEVVRSSMSGSSAGEKKKDASGKKGSEKSHALYLDALRARRPKLLMIAADCDPVIPPSQVAATAKAGGARFVCFGDGPKRVFPEDSSANAESELADADARAPEKGKAKRSSRREKAPRSDSDAALKAMLRDGGEHFSHYDLLCGRRAPELVFPEVSRFLGRIELFGGRVEL